MVHACRSQSSWSPRISESMGSRMGLVERAVKPAVPCASTVASLSMFARLVVRLGF